ncbi:MAG: protein translocase subunit SecD [Tepidisphaeraceae bacterium]
MQPNYLSRLILILVVLAAAVFLIFPPKSLFDPSVPFGKKLNLRPGIDMVGGTSLLYEIRPPEGSIAQADLAERTMEALKKRVDPDGVRNLIWRPQGANRLEIQMPLNTASGDASAKREAFGAAQAALEATNVRPGAVLRAVETLKGDERAAALDKLAGGSEQRQSLFGALRSVWDQTQQAKADQNAPVQAEKELEYDKLKAQLDETNLSAVEMQAVLDLSKEKRDARLAELKQKYAGWPERARAIDQFSGAYAGYQSVKGSLDDAQDLKRLLRGSGVLEFHILVTDPGDPTAQAMVQRLQEKGPRLQAGDTMQWFEVARPEEFGNQGVIGVYNDKTWALGYVTPDKSMSNRGGQNRWALESARPNLDPQTGTNVVAFRFNATGGQLFGQLTGGNVGQPMAITLDNKIISAPNIDSQIFRDGIITGGSGGFSTGELRYLVSTLNAGSLPAQLTDDPISERTVGPQLGEDNLRAGLIACAFGLVVVAVFLIGYYYLAGMVAFFAVVMNMALILGVMAMLNATFTLPSVAGIVLTIGMAVDANVLIFERLREEQVRGLSLRMALRNAYDRAWSAIVDSNVTTAITAAALYVLGSEEVKGFGLTLLIGIVASLFTALFVTRTIFGLLMERFNVEKLGSLPLTFPKWDRMLKPNIDWMGKTKYFYAFSGIFIVIGLAAFVAKFAQGQMLDIEFGSGTSVQFELRQPMAIDEVRGLLNGYSASHPVEFPTPNVVSVGADDRTYEVISSNKVAAEVRQSVLNALGDRLNVRLPSTFDRVDETFDQAMASGVVVPIESATQTVAGFSPESAAEHVGGAAIVLNNLAPPLAPSDIKKRVEQQRLQGSSGGMGYRDFDVESPAGNDERTSTAVVLVSDPSFPHDASDSLKAAQWQEQVAAPMWKLTTESISNPPTLQRVTNFDAQVAGETQRDALVAMVISVLGIMAYIWLRFGDLKYGTATVVALAHDTLFVLGALGIAHYLVDWSPPLSDALLIQPFRIGLTVVAAILTVMGWSMNDTVVVFDRIRENRGKFGHASRQVINDSINQTLSRTLLTGSTTILTIFVMYVWGGPGIHGFTFALLVGIIVGTYSSIAIASPILLLGGSREAESAGKTGQPQRQVGGGVQRIGA